MVKYGKRNCKQGLAMYQCQGVATQTLTQLLQYVWSAQP